MAQKTITQTAAATYSWKCPIGCTSISVALWGAGGGGGTRDTTGVGGGGGGAAYSLTPDLAVTPALTYSYVVPAAGTPGSSPANATFNTTSVVAESGKSVPLNTATGGAKGLATNSTGTTKYDGGVGVTGSAGSYSGGGGGSGGTGSNGNTGVTSTGAVAVTGGGNGGNGRTNAGAGAAPTTPPGGGGGGGYRTTSQTRLGGNGSPGKAELIFQDPQCTINLLGCGG